MPFLEETGAPLRVIHLTQAPADGRYFQLSEAIGFRERPGAPTYWAPAHRPADNPGDGNRTDLASVPWLLWNFIASYGRQSAPALIHDHRSELARHLDPTDAFAQRIEDDRVFRVGLRQQKVPLLRSWLMWIFVSLERYWAHARNLFFLIVAQCVLGTAAVYSSIILCENQPLWLLLLAAPTLVALVWRKEATLIVWATYAFAFLAPLLVGQLIVLLPFWIAELLTRELIDRPFVDDEPGPIAVPFGRAP